MKEQGYKITNLVGTSSDYSDKNNWLNTPNTDKPVDTFYIYPTVYMDTTEGAPDIADINSKIMRVGALHEYNIQATVFEDSTNVYAPYYRQSNLISVMNLTPEELEQCLMREQRTDIYGALDYFFENYNKGKPFILAGHSQGACILKIILKDYMQAHPEYYDRMIAAYVVGYSITKQDLTDYPYLKFAEKADDVGVVVSWNTEGLGNKNKNNFVVLDGAISINPINWKRDNTYVSASENLGSRILNNNTGKYDINVPGIADAQLDTERGVVLCTNTDYPYTNLGNLNIPSIFGPESLHAYDYSFYYYNIQENVASRVKAYFNK